MPEFFKKWLESLDPKQSDEMWLYFDGSSMDDALEIVAEKAKSGGYGVENGDGLVMEDPARK
jgi:hypothetical protein